MARPGPKIGAYGNSLEIGDKPIAFCATIRKLSFERGGNMSTVSVFDVAKCILEKKGPMTAMKLQKLVYYCQAWALVWDEEPLFQEKIEAWANGPVVRDLYCAHRGMFVVDKSSIARGNSSLLNQSQMETVEGVLDFYGDKTAQWLSDQTHCEGPWKDARTGLADNERGDSEITLASLHEYYSSI